jgi:membrane-associated phospholipid phosphatase
MTAVAAALVALSAWGMHAVKLSLSASQVLPRLIVLGLLLAGAAFYRWRKLDRAVNLILMTFWYILIGNLLLLPMYILARSNVELSDAWLARMDARLGVEVPAVMRLMERFPAVAWALGVSYDTLVVLMTLAIMVPPLCGRMDKAKEFALATVAAAALSLPLFAAFPALGPWHYYGYAPSPFQAEFMQVFLALRGDGRVVLDLTDLNGLICFPSFHTILALLSGAALWSIPYARWPGAVLALLIVLATVPIGGHYVVDVVAGLLVTPASLALARGYLWLEARGGAPRSPAGRG